MLINDVLPINWLQLNLVCSWFVTLGLVAFSFGYSSNGKLDQKQRQLMLIVMGSAVLIFLFGLVGLAILAIVIGIKKTTKFTKKIKKQ